MGVCVCMVQPNKQRLYEESYVYVHCPLRDNHIQCEAWLLLTFLRCFAPVFAQRLHGSRAEAPRCWLCCRDGTCKESLASSNFSFFDGLSTPFASPFCRFSNVITCSVGACNVHESPLHCRLWKPAARSKKEGIELAFRATVRQNGSVYW